MSGDYFATTPSGIYFTSMIVGTLILLVISKADIVHPFRVVWIFINLLMKIYYFWDLPIFPLWLHVYCNLAHVVYNIVLHGLKWRKLQPWYFVYLICVPSFWYFGWALA